MLAGGNGGGEVALHCRVGERGKTKLIRRFFKDKRRNGETSHQVDVENRAVIAIDVHVHGALLRCQTDGAVFQGERGVGCDVISETENCIFLNLKAA